jgi:outer membrane receptor protein involved in Fe transport
MPIVNFNLANTPATSTAPTSPSTRASARSPYDVLASFQDHLTWIKGRHTLKVGGYFEYMKNNEARGQRLDGPPRLPQNTANPIDTNFAFSNALLGVFNQYNEVNNYGSTKNRAQEAEWYLQDTWKATPRLTIDAGLRFLWYQPYYRSDDQTSNFVPSLYDPKKAPRLYQPAIVNGRRMALDPVTGQVLNAIYIGAYVPGTGDIANGCCSRTIPARRRDSARARASSPSPGSGSSWDCQGNGKTAVKLSGGLFHQARLGGGSLGNLRNPPYN